MTQSVNEPAPLHRNRQFTLLWAGSAASALGSELTRVAMPLLLLSTTGNAVLAGTVTSLLSASLIVTQIPAGVWVDRWDRRKILQICQFIQFLNSAILSVTLLAAGVHFVSFAVFAVVDGACQAFLNPAREVAIRGVVPLKQLPRAYSQEEARKHGARLLGPALGGVLYAAYALLPFVCDTVSFFVAWCCTLGAKVPRRPQVAPESTTTTSAAAATSATAEVPAIPEVPATPETQDNPTPGMLAEARSAVKWLVYQRGLRELILVIMAMNLLGGAFYIPMIDHIESLGGSSAITGVVLSGIGVGGLVGALASEHVTRRISPGWLAIAVPAIFGVCLMVAVIPISPWWPTFPLILFSLTTPALNVASQAITAQMVPHEMLGRVGALLTVVAGGLAPLGPLMGGILTARIGGGATLFWVGVGLLAVSCVGVTSSSLRNFRG